MIKEGSCIIISRILTSGSTYRLRVNGEPRQRRRGRRLVENELYFTGEIRDCLDLYVQCANGCKDVLKLNMP